MNPPSDQLREENSESSTVSRSDTTTEVTSIHPLNKNVAMVTWPLRTLVCFGDNSQIEVCEDGSTRNGFPKEEVRLLYTQPLIVDEEEEEEDDDDDDEEEGGEEEISFENTSCTSNIAKVDRPLFGGPNRFEAMEVLPAPRPVSTRMPSNDFLAVIDHLEKALDIVHHGRISDPDNLSSSSTDGTGTASFIPSSSSFPTLHNKNNSITSLKKLMTRFRRPQAEIQPRKKDVEAAQQRPCPHTFRRPTKKNTNISATLKFLFSPLLHRQTKSKKRRGETALLIPHKEPDSVSWLLPGDELGCECDKKVIKHRLPPTQKKKKKKKKKRTIRFLHRLLLGGCLPLMDSPEDSVIVDSGMNHQDDRTRSFSLEEDDEDDERQQEDNYDIFSRRFRNDEELIDHLVKACDKHSSLQEGFNCLQERIRTRSQGRLLAARNDNAESPEALPLSSSPLLDMSAVGTHHHHHHHPWGSVQPTTAAPPVSGGADDAHNDCIPSIASFSSLEEFLSSISDSDHSASVEALLFEQELEQLSTEELAELLDEELEKLMRDGLA